MTDNISLMQYLDQLRISRKIQIQELTKGIISRRSYSRFLSGEANISLVSLNKLVEKMGVPFKEYAFYVYNNEYFKNIDEINFFDLIREEKYQVAYKDFYTKMKTKIFQTYLCKKSLPMSIKLLEYKMNKINKADAMFSMADYLDLNALTKSKILSDDDIEALHLYVRICNDYDKSLIANILVGLLYENQYARLFIYYEHDEMLIYLTLLQALTTKSKMTESDHSNMIKTVQSVLEFHKRSKITLIDIRIFRILYEYIKSNKIRNKYITFHYLAAIQCSLVDKSLDHLTFIITQSDIDDFHECLNDDEVRLSNMYERLMPNGKFKGFV